MSEEKAMTDAVFNDFFKQDWVKPYVTVPVGASYHKVAYGEVAIEFAAFRGHVYLIGLFKDGVSPNSNREEILE